MLLEHLSQEHDLASRRLEFVEQASDWIHKDLLDEQPSKILDLACGPGLYLNALARREHRCVGIDFSPASVRHARQVNANLDVEFIEGDLRHTSFGEGFDLAIFLYGEFNVFTEDESLDLLRRAAIAAPLLVLEVQTAEHLLEWSKSGTEWRTGGPGLMSPRNHLQLTEHWFDEESLTVTSRFYVVDAETAEVSMFSQTDRIVPDDVWEPLLESAGWRIREWKPGLGDPSEKGFATIIADRIA